MLLNLNAVMSIIFNVPAAIASTIVASRAVRRLNKFTNRPAEVFSGGQASSTLAFRGAGLGALRSANSMKKGGDNGVHVQMDTFTLAETTRQGQSFFEYDAAGKVKGDGYVPDPEAQVISDEFKRPPY